MSLPGNGGRKGKASNWRGCEGTIDKVITNFGEAVASIGDGNVVRASRSASFSEPDGLH